MPAAISRRRNHDPLAKPSVQPSPTHAPGQWPMADLGSSQCRFACTPDNAPASEHRFCGRPTRIASRNLYGSWCEDHLLLVWGQGTKAERMATDRPRGE